MDRTEQLARLLDDGIVIAEASQRHSVLPHLRGARLALREAAAQDVPLRVDLLAGRVFACGVPAALSRAELALMVALALSDSGMTREDLAKILYPDLEATSAANAVKRDVHRVRRRLGLSDAIRWRNGVYILGEAVDVDLRRREAEFRHVQSGHTLNGDARDRMHVLRRRLAEGRPAFMLQWPWFERAEERLRSLARDVAVLLARDSLDAQHYEQAIDLACEIAAADPFDMDAAHIALHAFVLAGSCAAAVLGQLLGPEPCVTEFRD